MFELQLFYDIEGAISKKNTVYVAAFTLKEDFIE